MTSQSRDFEISRNLQTFCASLFQEVEWELNLIQCVKNHVEIANRFEDIRKIILLIKTHFLDFFSESKNNLRGFFLLII